MHEDEKKMIEEGTYEDLQVVQCSNSMRLSRLNVEHDGHHLVHNFSLTLKAGESFVLIGENGSGKSSILNTIAGMSHIHSGEAHAFGYDLLKAARFMSDNFLTYAMQKPVLMTSMTPE